MLIRRIGLLTLLCALATGLGTGCDNTTDGMADSGSDSGTDVDGGTLADDAGTLADDAGPPTDDGGFLADAGTPEDGGMDVDGGPPPIPCEPACDTGQACVRGVCLTSCDTDLGAWDAALSADLVPVSNFCRPGLNTWALVAREGTVSVYDVMQSEDAGTYSFALSSWTVDLAAIPVPTEVSVSERTPADGISLFPGADLALSTSTHRAAFGFTTAFGSGGDDGIFPVLLGDGTSEFVHINGNFDLTWVDDHNLLVNAADTSRGGQGLYWVNIDTSITVTQVASGPGGNSGSIAISSDGYVLVGGSDESFAPVLKVVGLDSLQSVVEGEGTMVALDDLDGPTGGDAGLQSIFELLPDGTLVYREFSADFSSSSLHAWDTTYTAEAGLVLSNKRTLATGGIFLRALSAVSGQYYFSHAEGLLVVQEAP